MILGMAFKNICSYRNDWLKDSINQKQPFYSSTFLTFLKLYKVVNKAVKMVYKNFFLPVVC